MKRILSITTLFLGVFLISQGCREKCEVCAECKYDVSDYPQSVIDSTDCIDKELCGDALEQAKNGDYDIIYCSE